MDETFNNINHNSIEEFILPSSDAIIKVIFATHLISFVKNIVKSAIMAVYKSFIDPTKNNSSSIESVRKALRDGNIVFETAIRYLNMSWVNYHNSADEIIRKKIDLMMKKGNFLHTSCIFSYIWDFSQILLIYTIGRIDVNELKDYEFLSDCIDIIADGIMAYHVDTINNRDYFCDEKCEVLLFKENNEFIKIKRK